MCMCVCLCADVEQLQRDDPTQSFQQRFIESMERLQADIGIDDLGRLYDVEVVQLDDKSTIKLVCFTSFSTHLGTCLLLLYRVSVCMCVCVSMDVCLTALSARRAARPPQEPLYVAPYGDL